MAEHPDVAPLRDTFATFVKDDLAALNWRLGRLAGGRNTLR
jgi:hypothetical protein